MIVPTTGAAATTVDEDFRTRAAAGRREKMRGRLLDAVLDLYQPGKGGAHLVVDDVIRAADVSRGSFYKYFDSLDEAIEDLGERLTEGMIADFGTLFGGTPDPAVRAIGGAVMPIARAWHDPRWAGFTCRVDYVDYFARQSAFDLMVRACLDAARQAGQLRFGSLDVAVDLIVGVTVEARRRMIRGVEAPRSYIDDIVGRTFAGLGMDADDAAAALAIAWSRIGSCAPALGWWPADSALSAPPPDQP